LTTSIFPTDPNNLIVAKFMMNGESQQDCVFLVHLARQTYSPAVSGGPAGVKTFSISPAVDGKTSWDTEVDGSLILSSAGTWTMTPTNNFSTTGRRAGAGGGTTGQAGDGLAGGAGGTQSGPGIGVSGGRRTGASGSGRNGGQLGTGSAATRTATGFGTGGAGALNAGDAGSGGGGAGYWGGAEGGGDSGGFGGGGGSGYFDSSLVSNATLYQGNYEVPGNSSDTNRGTAGNPGVGSTTAAAEGTSYSQNSLTLASDVGYEGKNTVGSSNWVGYVAAFYDNDTNSTPSNYFIEYHVPVGQCDRLDIGLAVRSSTTTAGTFTLNKAYTTNAGTNYEFAVSTVILMEIKQ